MTVTTKTNIVELKAYAKEIGCTGYSKFTAKQKGELVEMIQAQEKKNEEKAQEKAARKEEGKAAAKKVADEKVSPLRDKFLNKVYELVDNNNEVGTYEVVEVGYYLKDSNKIVADIVYTFTVIEISTLETSILTFEEFKESRAAALSLKDDSELERMKMLELKAVGQSLGIHDTWRFDSKNRKQLEALIREAKEREVKKQEHINFIKTLEMEEVILKLNEYDVMIGSPMIMQSGDINFRLKGSVASRHLTPAGFMEYYHAAQEDGRSFSQYRQDYIDYAKSFVGRKGMTKTTLYPSEVTVLDVTVVYEETNPNHITFLYQVDKGSWTATMRLSCLDREINFYEEAGEPAAVEEEVTEAKEVEPELIVEEALTKGANQLTFAVGEGCFQLTLDSLLD